MILKSFNITEKFLYSLEFLILSPGFSPSDIVYSECDSLVDALSTFKLPGLKTSEAHSVSFPVKSRKSLGNVINELAVLSGGKHFRKSWCKWSHFTVESGRHSAGTPPKVSPRSTRDIWTR